MELLNRGLTIPRGIAKRVLVSCFMLLWQFIFCYFLFTVKPLGSGAFGQVVLAQATGIIAFDPRGSTKRKPSRRRSRFGSTSRPYYNDKRVTAVAVKSLKGKSFAVT